MFKQALFVVSWFIAGGLTFYVFLQRGEIGSLNEELTVSRAFQQQYEQQVEVNALQRQQFETQTQQLQTNLRGTQVQMANLSEALQEAREMMTPVAEQGRE